jgi:TonB family protein
VENATALIRKLLTVAEQTCRRLTSSHLLAAVAAGARYVNGTPVHAAADGTRRPRLVYAPPDETCGHPDITSAGAGATVNYIGFAITALVAAVVPAAAQTADRQVSPAGRDECLEQADGEVSSYPILLNPVETRSAIRRSIPWDLRVRRVSGRATATLLIDTSGAVIHKALRKSSGSRRLDRALMTAVDAMRFLPAYLGRTPVCWRLDIPLIYPVPR